MANDANIVMISGRLTRDAELSYTNSGLAMLKFSIAVGSSYKKNDEWVNNVDFFEGVMWGKKAEKFSGLIKGDFVIATGSLKQDRWEKDGKKFSKVSINYDMLVKGVVEKQVSSEQENRPEAWEENVPF